MLKDIIEKRIDHLRNLSYKNEKLNDYEIRKNEEIGIRINECQQLWLILKKEAELQEETIKALIKYITFLKNKKYYDPLTMPTIKLIEKATGKKWEEIIKRWQINEEKDKNK